MKNKGKYAHIEELRAKLKASQKEFTQELTEVKKQYPLVALGYAIQKATIAELSYVRSAGDLEIGSISAALAITKPIIPDAVLSQRLEKLNRCLGRATSDSDTAGCFDAFSEGSWV